jgi:hypothetical protein
LYARHVPWEVVAPLGAARGGSLHPPRALTQSRSDPTPLPLGIPAYCLLGHLQYHPRRQDCQRTPMTKEPQRGHKKIPATQHAIKRAPRRQRRRRARLELA